MKTMVVYFSREGHVQKVAEVIAQERAAQLQISIGVKGKKYCISLQGGIFHEILLCLHIVADLERWNERNNLLVLHYIEGDFARIITKPLIRFFESLNPKTLLQNPSAFPKSGACVAKLPSGTSVAVWLDSLLGLFISKLPMTILMSLRFLFCCDLRPG